MGNEGKAWRCLVCGYIHYGEAPPVGCPVCSASADEFEPIESAASAAVEKPTVQKIVIAGAGIAGLSAAEAVREHAPDAEIVLFSAISFRSIRPVGTRKSGSNLNRIPR